MKKKDDITRLGHIVDAICRIEEYTRGVNKDTVQNDLPELKTLVEKLLA